MKNYLNIFLLFLAFLTTTVAVAQPGKGKGRERVEAAKVSFLTEKMSLTPEQAQKFWPLYNEMDDKRRELKRKSRVFRDEDLESLSDAQLKQGLKDMMDFRQKELDLEKAYQDKFLTVISPRLLASLYRSEKEFMRKLQQRMENRKSGRR